MPGSGKLRKALAFDQAPADCDSDLRGVSVGRQSPMFFRGIEIDRYLRQARLMAVALVCPQGSARVPASSTSLPSGVDAGTGSWASLFSGVGERCISSSCS